MLRLSLMNLLVELYVSLPAALPVTVLFNSRPIFPFTLRVHSVTTILLFPFLVASTFTLSHLKDLKSIFAGISVACHYPGCAIASCPYIIGEVLPTASRACLTLRFFS